MRPNTAARVAQAIQLLNLDGYGAYTTQQLADASGISRKTLARNQDLIECFYFALNKGGYHKCDPMKLA